MLLFVHPYLRGFLSVAHRFLSLLCVLFFLGIVWFDLGAGLNVPALVWHADWLLQITAGVSVTALFVYVWLVTYILDTRFHPEFIRAALEAESRSIPFRVVRWLLPSPPGAEADPDDLREGGDGLRWYLGVTFVPCTVLLLLPAFFAIDTTAWSVRLTSPDTGRAYIAERWPFAVGVVVAILAIRGISWVGGRVIRRRLTTERRKRLVRELWMQGVAGALFVALFVLYIVIAVLVWQDLWQPPPVTAVCMLIGLMAGVGGALWFHLRYWAVPVFAVGIAWLVYCNSPVYKVRFPHLGPEYDRRVTLEDYEEPALSLDGIGDDSDRKKEAERVARLIAALRVQAESRARAETANEREPKPTVEAEFGRLTADRLTNPAQYKALLEQHKAARAALTAAEEKALNDWRKQFRTKPRLVVVATTGGANRSALWTTKVLHELHRDPGLADFPKHVRIITGASGGMVGAAYYAGSLQTGGVLPAEFDPEDIAQDFLTPIINGLVFREVPFLALPVESYSRDRGELLDRAMEGDVPRLTAGPKKRLAAVFERSFADLATGEAAGWRPSLIFSPMIVEDGRRLFISNRHVPFLTVNRGEFLLPNGPEFAGPQASGGSKLEDNQKKSKAVGRGRAGTDDQDVYSRPGVEFFSLFPEARDRFRLSTAARMNATFPFLSPAVSLPTNPPRRIVDAGYYDNTGVGVAAAWLYHHADWIIKECSGVVVIQIRDSASHQENRSVALPPAEGGSVLPGITGVLSAVNHARTASATYRNDDDLYQLSQYFWMHGPWVSQFFTTVVFERYLDVGMNWYLSPADKDLIKDSWDKGPANMNPASLQKLRDWWKGAAKK
jgi:hypothetical protein